jgi:hypothetical protein
MIRLLLLAVLIIAMAAGSGEAQVFDDVTSSVLPGVDSAPGREGAEPSYTGGAAVGDCDGDGWLDLYMTGANHDVLYRNRGDGTFADVTLAANLGYTQGTRGAAFGDIDNDGDLDLYSTGYGDARHFLYINDGTCRFTEDAVARGVAVGSQAIGRGASFGDYDRDGYLDLYVTELAATLINPTFPGPASHLFHNRGAAAPGTFDDVTGVTGVELDAIVGTQDGTFAFTPRFSDFDRDGWPDLAVISDFQESRLFWNNRLGGFIDGTLAAGVGTDEHGMGATTADLDGDGRFDLFVTSIYVPGNPRGTGNRLYHNAGNRTFTDATDAAGVRDGDWGWGTEAFDYDNDGDLDLVLTNGADGDPASDPFVVPELGLTDLSPFANDPPRLWRNDGGGTFTEVAAAAGVVDAGVGFGVLPFDYDGDGDVDLLLTHDASQSPAFAAPRLLRNGGNGHHWLDIELTGRCAQRDGVGAIVTLTPSGGGLPMVREVSASSTYRAQDGSGRVHFGLGPGPVSVTALRVEWPSGTVQDVTGVAIDRVLQVTESCTPPGEPPGGPERACLLGLVAAGRNLVGAAAKNVFRCVRDASLERLPAGQTVAQCVAADGRGWVARAEARTVETETALCIGNVPNFGPRSAATVNGVFSNLVDLPDLLGADLEAGIQAGAGACETMVAKRSAKILKARLRAFADCADAGLRAGTITDADELSACDGADPKGKVARAVAKASAAIASRCATANVAAAFPGLCSAESAATLGSCVDLRLACDTCRGWNAVNGSTKVCHRFANGVASFYCGPRPTTTQSVARQWDEEILAAIRIDTPRPPVHARNLFHLAVAMWDAWAAYDPVADGYLVAEKDASADPDADRAVAVSFAAYRVLAARYAISPNAPTTAVALRDRMNVLGYDPDFTSMVGDDPAAVGNRIGAAVLAHGLTDGSNEEGNYADPTYTPVNEPLVVKQPGTTMAFPNQWQPLALDLIIGQNGIPIPGKVQTFVGAGWWNVLGFADDLLSVLPSPPPRLHDPVTDAAFKQAALDVLRAGSQVTPDDGVLLDISPGAYGNNPLGSNAGTGHPLNPVTGLPYASQVVKRGDFTRVLAEFWADGPDSETPPGHWNVVANYASDQMAEKRIGGTGPIVSPLEWDVKLYLALNGAVHDAAVGSWGTKRYYDSVRPISMIRYMGGLGQSSDPLGPSYHPDGLPLDPGVVEVITAASSAPGERHEALAAYVGEIAVLAWPGEPADRATQYSGVRWLRAKQWVPYQRKTFVTPPFAGYTSGHSTFSRAAAEVLTQFTGSPYFPGGLGEYVAPANAFLKFEIGPSETVRLQWATYYDASDQAGQSRIWGGIHIVADDFAGRVMGSAIGTDAYAKAQTYYLGTARP